MKSLCLEGNTVGVEAAEAIAGALEKHPEFQVSPKSNVFIGQEKNFLGHKIVNIFLSIALNMCFESSQYICFCSE